jgi:hypothetical protein
MSAAQRWVKEGLVFEPPGDMAWSRTHAAIPFADPRGDLYRVYFSARDERGRAQVGHFDLDLDARRVVSVGRRPDIGLGPLGAFDDSGVTTSWVVTHAGRKYHYYSGWSLGVTVPFYFYVGLAVSDDGGETYRRLSDAPVLGRSAADPYLTASPCVLVEEGVWRMWYVSGTRWELRDGRPHHYYRIHYAESGDGVNWERGGRVCVDYESAGEHAIARPCVIKDGGGYKMWFSHRGASYRIGYAESADGLTWERREAGLGLGPSETGWDSGMVEYAHVFDHRGRRYMLYNGNDYGKTGVGLAVLDGGL